MSIIKLYGDNVLRQKCEDVVFPDPILNQTILSMFLVMHKAMGVGLAANQVGINKRIAVINIDPELKEEERVILINPTIISSEGEQEMEEGCLSLPGFGVPCKRAMKVVVENYDTDGNKYTFEADDLLAVAVQHEIGHLNGRLFIDELSSLQKMLIEPRLKKFIREHKHDNQQGVK